MLKSVKCMIFVTLMGIRMSILFANQETEEFCKKDSCYNYMHPILNYQYSNVEWINQTKTFWKWLNSDKNMPIATFCNDNANIMVDENAQRPLVGPKDCSKVNGMNFVKFEGKFDKDKMLVGQGRAIALQRPEKITGNNCFDILPSILSIHGAFVKAQINGKATIHYNDDTKMKVTFVNGVIQGKVYLFAKHDELQGIGVYENGLPHGPFWFMYEEHYVFVHFIRGHIYEENVLVTNHGSEWAMLGRVLNNTYLVDARNIKIGWIGNYKCMPVIRIPTELSLDPLKSRMKLPIKIFPMLAEQKVMVRPSKIMYFNRVAKTGSQSFIKLFQILGDRLGIRKYKKKID